MVRVIVLAIANASMIIVRIPLQPDVVLNVIELTGRKVVIGTTCLQMQPTFSHVNCGGGVNGDGGVE